MEFFLNHLLEISIAFSFLFFMFIFFFNFKQIISYLKLDKKTIILLISIFVLSITLRLIFPQKMNIINIDEWWYMQAGRSLIETGSFGYYPKSIAWPAIISVSFLIFGLNNYVAIYTSLFFGSLSVFAMYFMAFTITHNKKISLLATLLLAVNYIHMTFSACAETNVTSLFFILLTVGFFFMYLSKRNIPALLLCISSLIVMVQFRTENYMYIALFGFGYFILSKKINLKEVSLLFLSLIVLFLFSGANLYQVYEFQTSTNWLELESKGKIEGENWSVQNLIHNSVTFGKYLFNTTLQPFIIPLFAFLGYLFYFFRQRRKSIFLLVWFLMLWVIYFASWFQTLVANTRFLMAFYPILFLFVAIGFEKIISTVRSFGAIRNFSKSLYVLLVVFILIFHYPFVISLTEKLPRVAQVDIIPNGFYILRTQMPETLESIIDESCTIIFPFPQHFLATTKLNSVSVQDFVSEPGYTINNSDCYYYYQSRACDADNNLESCKKIEETMNLEIFRSYTLRDGEATIYRILPNVDKS